MSEVSKVKCFSVSALIGLMILTGCATTSGVTPIGEDTFMISRNGAGFWSSTAQIKAEAFKDANTYCIKQGKHLQIVRTSQHEASGRPGDFPGAEIQFMCLTSNDRELSRPKLQKEADTIVKIKKDVRVKNTPKKHDGFYQELIKLEDLHKKGILTDEEFSKQKQKILNNN